MKKLLVGMLLVLTHGYGAAMDDNLETLVVTGTRDSQSLQNLAGNTAVLDSKVLQLVAHAHVQESLARVAGANLARGNGQEYLPALRSPVLTGAGACGSILSAVDGIALRSAGFCNINELFDAHTEQAERIEVVRGPGSALYGSNAMHGVINVITPSATREPHFSLGLEAGPHDYTRLKLSGSGTSGEHGLRADLVVGHDGGYRDDSGFDQQKFTLRHEFSTSEKLSLTTTLSVSNLNQETAGYVIGTDSYKDSDLRDTNPNPEAFRDSRSARLATRFDYTLDDKRHLLVTPYLRYTEMDFLQHFLPGNPLEENGQNSAGVQTAYYIDQSETLQWVAGLDFEYTEGFLKQSQDQPTEGSPFLIATIPEGKHYDYTVDALMLAPFAQVNWAINKQLSLTLGLRYEIMEYDYDNRMLSGRTAEDGSSCDFGGCRYSRPEDRDDRFENWSPKLGLLYQLGKNHRVYANLSRGFRAPQATELYRLQRDQLMADLDSEEMDSLEIGMRGDVGEFSYEAIAFAMQKKNVIYRDTEFFNIADGETRHQGLELTLNYTFAESWDLGLAASYAEHEYRDKRELNGVPIDGNDVDSAPHHFGSTRLGWNFTDGGRAELEWQHQGGYYTDPENLHRYSGHNLLNLRVSWQLTPQWQLMARITNLGDRDYAERADYSGFAGDRYFPGEPRSLYLGVESRW